MRRAPAVSDRAFVLRVSPYGDADAVVHLLTERAGVIGALARRARAPSAKRAIVLEPFHTLTVEVQATSGELANLKSATIATARTALLEDPARLDAAGLATRWTRALSPAHVPEPEVFAALERLLDDLAGAAAPIVGVTTPTPVESALTAFGLTLLDVLGYGLDLSGCARCARARPEGRAAYVSGAGGGVACEACRRGAATQAQLVSGALLDRAMHDARSLLSSTAEEVAPLARAVRDAIDMRARAVGARIAP
ncbi:MAG: DNA repair protein RecO [Deltaproteobacteria bacterium]|nr:DNA repair protein RecO [Deltaproteobacteria bacterium]